MDDIEYVKTTKTLEEIRKLGVPLSELEKNFTEEDKKEKEQRYYETLLAMKKLRERKNLTQQKLSRLSGIPRTTITKIESGNRNVTIDKLMSIAAAMDTTLVIKFEAKK